MNECIFIGITSYFFKKLFFICFMPHTYVKEKQLHTCMLLVANSTPIVDFDSKLNSFLVNLDKRLLFPTPESPIRTTGRKII